MKKIVYYATHLLRNFDETEYKDVKLYKDFFGHIFSATFMIDRTRTISNPFNTEIEDEQEIKSFDNYNITLDEAMFSCVSDLISLNKKIYLMWSGGIDSTAMLVAFLKSNFDLSNVVVVLNIDSIKENYNFYKSYILSRFRLCSTEEIIQTAKNKILDGIIVQAEHADLLFSVSLSRSMKKTISDDFIQDKFSRENTVKFFTARGLGNLSANCIYDVASLSSKKSPIPIETMNDFSWWYSFNFRWQHNYQKFRARINPKNDYATFFSHSQLQRWAVKNQLDNSKILDEKTEFRRVIREYTGDTNYSDHKIKWSSHSKHFATNSALAIALDGELLTERFNLVSYYNPNNFFNLWLKNR